MTNNGNDSSEHLQLAFDFIQYTNRNIFLTGKAGTGKTTFLHRLRRSAVKQMIVVAPTGVAAINAGGVTIHSFFQLGFGPLIPGAAHSAASGNNSASQAIHRFSRDKINIIKSLDLLVIDEVSMVRADLLDGIDAVLRRFRGRSKPFGGVQLLLIGDLHQLAPVIKEEEWKILKPYYENGFFFSSKALQETSYLSIELKHIFRQSDQRFIDLLNRVRENSMDSGTWQELNSRHIPGFSPGDREGYITLTTHNAQAQELNERKLAEVPGKQHTFTATLKGDFPEYSFPTDKELRLKIDAQVMFVKNDPGAEKRFFNGKIGRVTDIDGEHISVLCEGDEEEIAVTALEWQNVKYSINEQSKEISEEVVGTFLQYPLKLAWAITIHKSQGLTFEKAIIDARSAFAHGQVYVALSRCRSLEGLVLSTPINANSLYSNTTVNQFSSQVEKNMPSPDILSRARCEYEEALIFEIFDFSATERRMRQLAQLNEQHAASLAGNLTGVLSRMQAAGREEILTVASRFRSQVQQLLALEPVIEKNEALQDRVRKAAVYFSDRLRSLLREPFSEISYETDNKAIAKELDEAMGRLGHELGLRKAGLESCLEGFNVKRYLRAKASAQLEENQGWKPAGVKHREGRGTGEHPLFFIALKQWRQRKAEQEETEPRHIFTQGVLLRLADELPCTLKDILAIKGFGKKKAMRYGQDLLRMILEYRKEKQMEVPEEGLRDIEKGLPAKITTQQASLELFKAGKSVEQIARLRTLSPVTIEGHLATFVQRGELPPDALIDATSLARILEYFAGTRDQSLRTAFDALDEAFTFGELKIALSYHLFLAGSNQGKTP